jgi:hypothetical protein
VYAVSVDAGMSCPPVIVRVEDSRYAEVELVCDTGIR